MAIFHLSVQVVSRSAGKSVVAAAAYRAGTALTDTRQGLTHDYSRRGDVRETVILAPADAPAWVHDRQALWTAVDAAEKRQDAQTAREVEVSLPRELTRDQQRALVTAFVQQEFVARGMVADVSIHEGHRDAEPNPHVHILLTTRTIGPQGFGKKDRTWNASALVMDWRQAWEQAANTALTQAGHAAHIDARSHAARHLAELPTVHEGPHVTAMSAQGIPTDRRDLNDTIRAHNALLADIQIAHAEAAAARAEQQQKEEKAIAARRRQGWTDKEIAAQQQVTRQHTTLKAAFTQALQALAVDPLVLSLAQSADPAAAFAAQWRTSEGLTLEELARRVPVAYRESLSGGQYHQQALAKYTEQLSTWNKKHWTYRLFHRTEAHANGGQLRQKIAEQHRFLDELRPAIAEWQHAQKAYASGQQQIVDDWQAWQPHVEQTRTALSAAHVLGTITALTAMEQEQQHSPLWPMEFFRRALVDDARTISARILTQRVADWRTPDVFTRFMEQLPLTLQDLHAEQQAAQEHEATYRAAAAQTATERLQDARRQRRQPMRHPKDQEPEFER